MPTDRKLAGVILAAGKGTRMKSDLPKCLHALAGLPMAEHVGRALRGAGCDPVVMVVGHGADQLRAGLPDGLYAYAVQHEQLGTGHAVAMAEVALSEFDGDVVIAAGDTPLLTDLVIRELVQHHGSTGAMVTLASCRVDQPTGYGRVVRDAEGRLQRIVEQKDADPETLRITEVNSGVYVVDAATLFRTLPELGRNNAAGEIYLTDLITSVVAAGGAAEAYCFSDEAPFAGVNDRWQLAQAGDVLQQRIRRKWATAGVTLEDPRTTFIDADVEIGPNTVLRPMTTLSGQTRVGERCVIGPGSQLIDAVLGDHVVVWQSVVNRATMATGSRCGPFAHLRPGADLGEGTKVGNFVEIKNTALGAGVSVSHLTYLGDARVGAGTNIGAGTITCNYDGVHKHVTAIGSGCFVGSNSTLVAPVAIGDGAFVAAGSVITRDVPPDALALGRARQEEKEGWAARWRKQWQEDNT